MRGTQREVAWPTMLLMVLIPVLALAGPIITGDSSGLAFLAPLLVAALLPTRLFTAWAPTAVPVPVRMGRHETDTLAPSHVELRGRPQRPRAPGCGLL